MNGARNLKIDGSARRVAALCGIHFGQELFALVVVSSGHKRSAMNVGCSRPTKIGITIHRNQRKTDVSTLSEKLAPNIAVKAAPFGRWTSRKRAALYLQSFIHHARLKRTYLLW